MGASAAMSANIQSGSKNTFIGFQSDASGGDWSNSTAIVTNALVGESNAMVLGGAYGSGYAENVGIGTSTPNQLLSVYGTTNWGQIQTISTSSGAESDIGFSDGTGNIWAVGQNIGTNANTNKFSIFSQAAYKNLFTIQPNGNVGIGTTSPGAVLSLSNTFGSQLTGTSASTTFTTYSGSLGTTSGNTLKLASIGFASTNQSSLGIKAIRTANAATWTSTAIGLEMDVDNTDAVNGASLWLNENGNVGIGTSAPTQKLSVNGSICYTVGIAACSDVRFKKDFTVLENPLERVLKMEGLNYYWRKEEFPDRAFNDKKQIGFKAQDLQKILPEVVIEDTDGYLSVDYSRLTPILVEAIKEQQKIIDEQNKKIESQSNNITEQNKSIEQLKEEVKTIQALLNNNAWLLKPVITNNVLTEKK